VVRPMEPKSRSLAQQRFTAFAESYATSRPHAAGDSLRRLVELVGPQADWLALDIATGAGHMALALAPHVAHVVASDLTLQMLAVARGLAQRRCIANVSFADLRAEALPFADATFDVVTCRIAPHHFDDVRKFAGESARVLRTGGRFGLVDNIAPDPSTTPGDAAALAEAADEYNAFERLRDPSHIRCLALAEWRDVVAEAGLAERHVELLDKQIIFGPWADQQEVGDAARRELKSRLLYGSAAFRAFTRAEEKSGDLGFTLTEVVMVAEKQLPVDAR
jgi:ubiquinone/menaquinone biosynthesis C-methylase UbiE